MTNQIAEGVSNAPMLRVGLARSGYHGVRKVAQFNLVSFSECRAFSLAGERMLDEPLLNLK